MNADQWKTKLFPLDYITALHTATVAFKQFEKAISAINNNQGSNMNADKFKYGDIVEFLDHKGTKRGYIDMDHKIRCPHPVYETHPIYDNTKLIKAGGWLTRTETKVTNIEINLKTKYSFDMLVMTTHGMEIVSINCHCKQFD